MSEPIAFRRIDQVECQMATPLPEVEENIRLSLKRKLPEIEWLPEWNKPKGDEPFAIAGGGPSIHYTHHELKHFRRIIAAGSSHDWLIEHGIRPTYCLILDPDPVSANYLKKPDHLCNYLVASCCSPKVFEALEGYPVTLWHSAGPDEEWFGETWKEAGFATLDKKPIIGGGPTCGLRSVSMAMCLGYKNLHLFGLDSNLDIHTGAHHAYDFVDPENEFLGDVLPMRLGMPGTKTENGRLFYVAKYMMAQLWGFQELIAGYGHAFNVTVHGDSILSEWVRIRKLTMEEKKAEAA